MAMESAAARAKIPCAACRILRRRCLKDCILSPHLPPTEPEKFVAVHWVFGANNVCKMLQVKSDLKSMRFPLLDRGDAVTSMVYEAKARLADPVYGCVAFVASLQRQVSHLQSELNAALAEAMVLRAQLLEALSTSPIHSQPQDDARISKERDLEAQSCFWEWSGTWGEENLGTEDPVP
ncbi:hypothetical protein RHSIM_Rhsim13G0056700 [Rhododendron simsii]|uniref:LOB domain-containing protein n=1 Tax=Rhododendron simsii TaxID=118357 RepID=A0A834L610_RHOSS|nr:hypothetical protein RHSIM_Rhsim13G0056700 [Rhododendron simsii]